MRNNLDDLVPGARICVDRVPYSCATRISIDARDAWITLISPSKPGTHVEQYRSAFLSDLIELHEAGRLIIGCAHPDASGVHVIAPLAA